MHQFKDYFDIAKEILQNTSPSNNRTDTDAYRVFGRQMRFDLKDGRFPLMDEKHVSFKNVLSELLWFINGGTNIKELHEHGNHIWDEWADTNGDLGPIYGKQWTSWANPTGFNVNQISKAIHTLLFMPDSRRIIVSAWNPNDLPNEAESPHENVEKGKMALAPCHMLFQFSTRDVTDDFIRRAPGHFVSNRWAMPTKMLSCRVDQRSMDMFLGAPYNIASYAILLQMVAKLTNMLPDELIFHVGDAHIYSNHVEQMRTLIGKHDSGERANSRPMVEIVGEQKWIEEFKMQNFKLSGYDPAIVLTGKVAV